MFGDRHDVGGAHMNFQSSLWPPVATETFSGDQDYHREEENLFAKGEQTHIHAQQWAALHVESKREEQD